MRIVFAADAYKPYVSGVTLYMSQHKEALQKLGHTVRLVTFGDRHSPPEEGVIYSPGIRMRMGFTFGLGYNQAALDSLRSADVIHLHHPFISAQWVIRAVRNRTVPLVFTAHTRYDQYLRDYLPWLPEQFGSAVLKAYMPGFCARMARVICNSAASEQGMRLCGVTRALDRIPNGIQLAPFLTARRDEALRKELAGGAQVLFLYVGRLSVDKNLPLLLDAFARICRRGPSVRLALVGAGPFAAHLKEWCARLGIGEYVVFTGQVPHDRLPAYYASADVFVIPSIHDTHPLVVLEALGAGLPVAAVESPAYMDLVQSGENGILAQNEAGSFASALGELAGNSAERNRMSRRSREVSGGFSVERTAQELLNLYHCAAAGSLP